MGTACAAGTSLAAVSYGYLVKTFGDQLQTDLAVATTAHPTWIWPLALAIFAATLCRAGFLYGMSLSNNVGVQRALVDIQSAQFKALMDGDFQRLSKEASGQFVSRFINDINVLRDCGLRLANNATKSVVTLIGAFAAMLWMDWQLTVFLLIVYPLAYGPVTRLGKRIRVHASRAQAQIGVVSAFLTEGFQGARLIKAYGLEPRQNAQARAGFTERAKLYLKVLRDKAAVDPILEVAGGLALSGILAFSAFRVANGATSFGDLLGFVALIGVAAPELRAIGTLSTVAQEGGAAADRVFELLDHPAKVKAPSSPISLGAVKGHIRFDSVSFTYEGADTPALQDVSFEVQPGERVAIVGPSGAGKSTIFSLLLRLYDPQSGSIALDSVALKDLTFDNLRSAFALVEQESILFDDTAAANIALGRPNVSLNELEAAARAAEVHDFIAAKPGGYKFQLGEGGATLSGGQRQRIALARALLRDAPVLLLDEATAALDTETEARIQIAVEQASEGRTVLTIAHKLKTARRADRILVFDEGRLAEVGVHETLAQAGGVYAKMLNSDLAE